MTMLHLFVFGCVSSYTLSFSRRPSFETDWSLFILKRADFVQVGGTHTVWSKVGRNTQMRLLNIPFLSWS